MKATEAKLLSYLQKSCQFIIPIYQRTYSTIKAARWPIPRNGGRQTRAIHSNSEP